MKNEINLNYKPKRTNQTLSWKINKKGLVVSRKNGGFFKLDNIGSFVWLLLDGKHNVKKIWKLTANAFEKNNPPIALFNIIVFLKYLASQDIVILDYNPLFPKQSK